MTRALLAGLLLAGLLFLGSPAAAGALAKAFASGELSRAAESLDHDTTPDDAADAAARCKLLLFENRLAAATACLEARRALAPDDKSILGDLALAAFRRGDFATAARDYERAGRALKAAEAQTLAGGRAYRIERPKPAYVIPFLQTDPLPILAVRLGDGRTHDFVLDTGAAETILDPKLADALGLTPLAGATTGAFAGGRTAAVRYAILPRLEMGDLVMTRLPVQLLATEGFAAALGGTPVEGVLGVDLLRHFLATLDYPRARLILRQAGGRRGAAQGAFPFWIAGDHLLLAEAAINGAPQLALIDTGLAGEGCTLPHSTLTAIGAQVDGAPVSGVGGGGVTSATRFTAKTLTLGPETRTDTPCLYGPFPAPLETSTGARIGLLISHAFLETAALTIDFARMRMSLTVPSREGPGA